MAFANLASIQSLLRVSVSLAMMVFMLITTANSYIDGNRWSSAIKPGRSIVRAEHVVIPQPETVLAACDEVMAIATPEVEEDLRRALE